MLKFCLFDKRAVHVMNSNNGNSAVKMPISLEFFTDLVLIYTNLSPTWN